MLNGRVAVMMVASLTLFGVIALAQEPPLSWKGKGEATFISEEGTRDLKFDFTLNVDKDGMVSGESSTQDGSARIERVYYSEGIKSEIPRLESRKLIVVLSLRSSDAPTLIIMNGQSLANKFCYGELRVVRQSAEGIKEALEIGNKEATLVGEGALPSGVQKGLQKSAPMGCFKMIGNFVAKEKE